MPARLDLLRPFILLLGLLLPAFPAGADQAKRPEGEAAQLTQAQKRKLTEACYEVLVPKPEHDPLTYEKPLPWDLLPFHIRNDKYFSIGTAFAVSPTELLTAFHVLDPTQDSLTHRRFLIRNARQEVFEVDRVTACSQRRDVIRFTVRDHRLPAWLDLNPAYELNSTVFTVGNALGEGVVIRRGDLIGTLPEEIEGAWKFLRSSADVNGGNSGGALVDLSGQVIGLVVRRNDNISLSVPVSEILGLKTDAAHFYRKTTYSFDLVEDKLGPVTDEFELPLPASFPDLRAAACTRIRADYDKRMEELLRGASLFPRGDTSLKALRETPPTRFLSVLKRDRNTNAWDYVSMNPNTFELPSKGSVKLANFQDKVLFCMMEPPSDLGAESLHASPRRVMDLFLKALNLPFNVAGQPVRMLSFGDPVRTESYVDPLGRPWQIHVWVRPWDDMAIIAFGTPVPKGRAMLLKEIRSTLVDSWIYDLKRIADLTTLPLEGTLAEWEAWLKLPPATRPLPDARIAFQPGRSLALNLPGFEGAFTNEDLSLDPKSTLRLALGLSRQGDGLAFDLRSLSVAEPEWASSITLSKHLAPQPTDGEAERKAWQKLVEGRAPYDGKASEEEGETSLSRVVEPPGAGPEARAKAAALYTLDLSRTGSVSNREMRKRMDRIAAALRPATPATAP